MAAKQSRAGIALGVSRTRALSVPPGLGVNSDATRERGIGSQFKPADDQPSDVQKESRQVHLEGAAQILQRPRSAGSKGGDEFFSKHFSPRLHVLRAKHDEFDFDIAPHGAEAAASGGSHYQPAPGDAQAHTPARRWVGSTSTNDGAPPLQPSASASEQRSGSWSEACKPPPPALSSLECFSATPGASSSRHDAVTSNVPSSAASPWFAPGATSCSSTNATKNIPRPFFAKPGLTEPEHDPFGDEPEDDPFGDEPEHDPLSDDGMDQEHDRNVDWSAGSAQHEEGSCRPCLYYRTSKGCRNGRDCDWCHLRHNFPKRTRPCKAQRARCKKVVKMLDNDSSGRPQQLTGDLYRRWARCSASPNERAYLHEVFVNSRAESREGRREEHEISLAGTAQDGMWHQSSKLWKLWKIAL